MPSTDSIVSRLPRLHWFSWCAGLFAAAILGIIIVPGEYLATRHDGELTDWDHLCQKFHQATYDKHRALVRDLDWPHVSVSLFEHGWPRPYLVRALVWKQTPSGKQHRQESEPLVRVESYFTHWGGSTYHGASWSNYDCWPFSADDWLLRPGWLAIDLMIAAAIVGLVAGLTEGRIRRRKGLFHFRMTDLLGALTLIGLGLGYYTYHDRIQHLESQGNERPLPPGFSSHQGAVSWGQNYHGPVWLRKLAGNAYYLRTLHHVDSASIGFREHWEEAYASLPQLPYLQQVGVGQGLPLAAIEYFKRCPRLAELDLPRLDRQPRHVPPLASRVPILTVDDLGLLARLRLRAIRLSGDAIGASEVERVAEFPALRHIILQDVAATNDELDAIRMRHPRVMITVRPSIKVFLSP